MNAIALNDDLSLSRNLDRAAMTAIKGGSVERHLRSATTYWSTDWSGDTKISSQMVGLSFHDGYLSRHSIETYKRTRTQTQISIYDVFTRA